MKILQINKYHYVRGGSDRVYFNTGELLTRNGHEVLYFAMDWLENYKSKDNLFFPKGMDFTKMDFTEKISNVSSFFFNKNAELKLNELLEKEKPDIAHLHIFYGSLSSSILKALKSHRVPIVVSIHDYKLICPSYLMLDGANSICDLCCTGNYYNSILKKCVKNSRLNSAIFALETYYRDFNFPILRMFDKLIFVSQFSKKLHLKYRPEWSGISTHLYNFNPVIVRDGKEQSAGNYFLYAGRISKEKGLSTLIDSFRLINNAQLRIVGTGDLVSTLSKEEYNNVMFLGYKNAKELREIIFNCSFVIVPSEWYENNPMAIIEAYSLGKPVIAARIGGISEIVIDGVTGFLFESGNSRNLEEVIRRSIALSRIEYLNMSNSAFSFAENNFSSEGHYSRLLDIYNEVLSSRSSK
jgi:glycosyltransferase involved in cell wall biosynthesis